MWEYKVEHIKTAGTTNLVMSKNDQDLMNKLGGEGWELVEAVPTVNGRTIIMFFKRAL